MHSHDKLTGTLCKCMPCAKARASRLDREARIRYSLDYGTLDRAMLRTETEIEQAQRELCEIKKEKAELIEMVRQEILDESR